MRFHRERRSFLSIYADDFKMAGLSMGLEGFAHSAAALPQQLVRVSGRASVRSVAGASGGDFLYFF